jgi:hypothetical protein
LRINDLDGALVEIVKYGKAIHTFLGQLASKDGLVGF